MDPWLIAVCLHYVDLHLADFKYGQIGHLVDRGSKNDISSKIWQIDEDGVKGL